MAGINHNIFSSSEQNYNCKNDLKKITHDLNNLLNNVLNGLELLNDNLDSRTTSIELLAKLKKNTLLASNIISNIGNKQSSSSIKEKIHLNKLINETVDLFELKAPNQKVIHYTNNSYNDLIWGSFIEINRVIINILNNAIEADKNTIIFITLNQLPDDKIEISIKDDGPGINSANIKNIFKEGFSTKKENNSTNSGLGLSIVKEIIEEHNGGITVESKIGKGTLFKIVFPLYKKEYHKSFVDKTIIIGEDDPFQLEVLKDLLCSLKIKTLSASNGKEVLDLLKDNSPDLIFIDRTMPVMDGIECIENIKQMKLTFPIILTSGSDIESLKDKFKISEVLKKPYSFEMVQNILERFI